MRWWAYFRMGAIILLSLGGLVYLAQGNYETATLCYVLVLIFRSDQ